VLQPVIWADAVGVNPRMTARRPKGVTIYGSHMSEHLKTTVYLDRDAYGRLKALARARRCPPAQLVREAVAQYAARETPARKPRSIAAGTSGRRNLSERDEDLLARMPRR